MLFAKVCSLFPLLFVMAMLLKYIFSIKRVKKNGKKYKAVEMLRAVSFPCQTAVMRQASWPVVVDPA